MSEGRTSSAVKIPFSWERKPGVPKSTMDKSSPRDHKFVPKLQPPPCTSEAARRFSKKALNRMQDYDPFLKAYQECTKTPKSVERNNMLLKTSIKARFKNSVTFNSCKRSCIVCEDNFITISHLPHTEDQD
ncbi:hypothetical protein VNO77_10546 [Canavalia gladiata]|uniref:Uncharacterized protein n=1 Tax=Canavalia gladiata TaxID=3824 RepID=A0AAN9QUT0_CANGL